MAFHRTCPGQGGHCSDGKRDGRWISTCSSSSLAPKALAPEALKERLVAEYGKAARMEIIKGAEEWLPESGLVRSSGFTGSTPPPRFLTGPPGVASNAPRTHFDAYLLQSGQTGSLIVIATTTRDAVAAYRREVEQILKTVEIPNPKR